MSVKKSVLLALLLVLSAACWAATEINGNKNIPDSIPIQEVHYQDGVPYYVTRMVPNVMDEYSGYTNNSRETITTRTVVSSRSWTIGTGGNFADINAAMADSRVVDGDVLKLTSGSVIIGTQTINKAIWLQGNGYRKDNNGNLEEDVARINGYLNISTDGIRISNLAMAMWPIEGESGSYHMPSIRVNAAYFVMEGCFVDGFISGYSDNATVRQSFIRGINGYEHGGWMIQNNIFATNSSNGYDLISKLINSTIDHNIIYSSFESKYSANYLISSISSCIISNNIIVHFPWDKDRTGTFNGTVESDCMTKNTVSHNVFTGSSPITNNKSGVNAIGDIFDYKKNTSSLYNIYKYDACFQLISNSPAKGYAIDGGDCGPWSGSYPYVIGGTVGGGGSAVNEKEAYAVYTDDGTLTFYYDNQKGKRSGTSYELNTGTNRPGWYDNRASITKAVFDVSFADARPTTTYLWFYEAKNLTSIEGIKNLNTSNVTDMSCMFRGCSSLISLDLSNFNTSNVTGMGEMFSGCSGLTSLNVSNFNTSNVTSMGGMFYGCSGLTSLDLSKFNTSKVKSMGGMFEGCSGLISLDVSSFNTSNVKSMYYMFDGCSGLISLDVSSFNTSNVVDMSNMFYNCRKLTSLDVSGFNTSSVTEMASMFYYCSSLKNLDVSGFNTGKVTNFVGFFMGCSSLISLDLSSFETRQAWNMNQMFCNCSSLTSINLSSFNTSNVMHMYCMFSNCSSLTSIDLSSFDTSKVTDMSYLFCNCRGLKSLDLSSFDTSNVTDMNTMFSGCSSLTTIYCGESWTTNNVTESKGMFYECIKLVGGAGTKYDSWYREKDYAHVDGGPSNPGYLTLKGGEVVDGDDLQRYLDSLVDTEDEFVNNVYRRVFLNDDWQALYVPFEMNYSDWADKFEVASIYGFYWYDDDDDNYVDRQELVATKVESGSLQANFPYLIRAKAKTGATLTVNVTGDVSQRITVAYMEISPVTYYFTGNYSQLTGLMSGSCYRLQGGSLFIPLSDSEVLQPYRWYMNISAGSTQSVRLNIVTDSETTAIEKVKKSQLRIHQSQYSPQAYDLSGRRVDADAKSLRKGIYIINNKKCVVK